MRPSKLVCLSITISPVVTNTCEGPFTSPKNSKIMKKILEHENLIAEKNPQSRRKVSIGPDSMAGTSAIHGHESNDVDFALRGEKLEEQAELRLSTENARPSTVDSNHVKRKERETEGHIPAAGVRMGKKARQDAGVVSASPVPVTLEEVHSCIQVLKGIVVDMRDELTRLRKDLRELSEKK